MTEYEKQIIKCRMNKPEISYRSQFNFNEKINKILDDKIKNKNKSSINKKEGNNFVMMKGKNELPNIFFDDLLHLEYLFTIDPDKEKYFEITNMLIVNLLFIKNHENYIFY